MSNWYNPIEGEPLFYNHRDHNEGEPISDHNEGKLMPNHNELEPIYAEGAGTHDIDGDMGERIHRLQTANLKTYTSRKNKKSSCVIPPYTSQSLVPNSSTDPSGNDSSLIESPSIDSNSDTDNLPIALRKGVRSCTQHPISQFVSYDRLSFSYHAFVSSLSSISIPQKWHDSVMIPKWK
jgi:hypothetical protein